MSGSRSEPVMGQLKVYGQERSVIPGLTRNLPHKR